MHLMLRAHTRRDQPFAETLRLADRIERERKLRCALHAEERRGAADRDDQRVVFELAFGQQFCAIVVEYRTERETLVRTVQTGQIALLKLKAVPARLRRVFEFLGERVHAAGCHFMQQRLPDMGWITVHERHLRVHTTFVLVGRIAVA